jgi:hypothetical protein
MIRCGTVRTVKDTPAVLFCLRAVHVLHVPFCVSGAKICGMRRIVCGMRLIVCAISGSPPVYDGGITRQEDEPLCKGEQ